VNWPLGQQVDILGEHGEQAALDEVGDALDLHSRPFQHRARPARVLLSSRVTRAAYLDGVERVGVGPDADQALLDVSSRRSSR
jgi:hypothetical protein